MSDANKIFLLVLALIALLLAGPLLTIWSLNTLFGLGIPYTLMTWLATAWLGTVTFGNVAHAIRRNKD